MKQESLKFSGRASNPATKKFSPAQIAAQKLFAERARAGTLGKGKRKAAVKRKANPVTETLIYGLAPGETRDYMEELMYAGGLKLTPAEIDKVLKAAGDAGYHSFRIAGFDPTMKPDFAKAVKRNLSKSQIAAASKVMAKRNPDKSKPRAYVKRVSQATGAPPTKRLVKRRTKALFAPAGYFPNPKVKYTNRAKDMQGDQRVGYAVHMADRPSYQAIAWFTKKDDAVKVAQEASDRTGKQLAVTRVQNYFGAM